MAKQTPLARRSAYSRCLRLLGGDPNGSEFPTLPKTNQLRLVGYPIIIHMVFYIPGGDITLPKFNSSYFSPEKLPTPNRKGSSSCPTIFPG